MFPSTAAGHGDIQNGQAAAGALTGAAVAIAIPNTMHPRGWGV